jgi:hypothetical protein
LTPIPLKKPLRLSFRMVSHMHCKNPGTYF